MSAKDQRNNSTLGMEPSDSEGDEEVFFDARYSPEEEAELLAESNKLKATANKLFASSRYSEAITTYERALASCPNYLEFEIAVLRSNLAACHLKLEDWKAAVDAATASIECLERLLPSSSKNAKNQRNKNGGTGTDTTHVEDDKSTHKVVELRGDGEDDESAQLKRLVENDTKREDVMRIRAKSLMRRGRARMELGGWANLQGAEEDYKELLQLKVLPPQDERMVREKLRELRPRLNAAKEKEMAEMLGKLKELGNGILRPFGLSTDNFKFVKDEKTGGYSMSFQK
ncbi:hypothetical protein VTO42DRAFT_7719 [Malbranchea cinnamomea]